MNQLLEPKNIELTGYAYLFPNMTQVITIMTGWIDKDKAPRGEKKNCPKMHASYCPFCGIKIDDPNPDKGEVFYQIKQEKKSNSVISASSAVK